MTITFQSGAFVMSNEWGWLKGTTRTEDGITLTVFPPVDHRKEGYIKPSAEVLDNVFRSMFDFIKSQK